MTHPLARVCRAIGLACLAAAPALGLALALADEAARMAKAAKTANLTPE
jgi:hypothetical protein